MTSTLPNDNLKKNFGDQISNKLISEIIRDQRSRKNKTNYSRNKEIKYFLCNKFKNITNQFFQLI